MREIKFRAWDKIHKKMLYEGDPELDHYALTFDGDIVEAADTDLVFADGAIAFLKIMQYTGLKDKNGKECFEGDIVQINTSEKEVVEVEDMREFYATYISDLSYPESAFEVIGNIYENPELINK